MKNILAVATILMFASGSMAQVAPIPKNAEKAVVEIYRFDIDSNGRVDTVLHGTGFIVRDSSKNLRFLVTNRHVLAGRTSIEVRIPTGSNNLAKYTISLIGASKLPLWVGHPDKDIDLALFLIPDEVKSYAFNSSRLKSSDEVGLGDAVYFIGFPELTGLVTPVVRFGVVSAKLRVPMEAKTERDTTVLLPRGALLIDGTALGGNSGSPVLSCTHPGKEAAKLIGVISGYLTSSSAHDPNLCGVMPAERLIELLAMVRPN